MKINEMRQKSITELNSELMESLKEQFVFRMQRSSGQLARSSEMKNVRRKIARIKTVLNEVQSVDTGK